MIKARKHNYSGGGRKPYKHDVFGRFVDWIALPTEDRTKQGLPTQKSFAKKYGVQPKTLIEWKKRNDFGEQKREAQILRLQNDTADVLEGLKNRCIKYGMAYDVELFLLYVEKWDRKHVLEILGEVKLGDNDIRSLVDLLPEAKQQQFYDVLTNLIAEAESARAIKSD